MKRGVVILLLLLLVFPAAAELSEKDIASLRDEFEAFFPDNPTIQMGSGLSLTEKTLFKTLFAKSGYASRFIITDDNQQMQSSVVLLGEQTNKQIGIVEKGALVSQSAYGPLRFSYYNVSGQKVMVAKTVREDENFKLQGISKSPLAKFLPPALVPVAASLISLLLMLLLQFLMNTATGMGKTALTILAGKEYKKRFDEGEAKKHLKFHVVELPLREVITILLVILILTTAKTWSFSPIWWDVFIVILVTTAILTVIRESARIVLARARHIHVESVFWPAGALLTLLSAWLGTLFALPSYLRIRKDEGKKWGEVSLRVAWITMAVAVVAFGLNFWWPNPYWQTLSVLASTVAFIGLVPIPPLAGATIWKRGKLGWAIAFVVALPLYLIIAFLSQYLG